MSTWQASIHVPEGCVVLMSGNEFVGKTTGSDDQGKLYCVLGNRRLVAESRLNPLRFSVERRYVGGRGRLYGTAKQVVRFSQPNNWGSLTECCGVTCDGLTSNPGEVAILLAAERESELITKNYAPLGFKTIPFKAARVLWALLRSS